MTHSLTRLFLLFSVLLAVGCGSNSVNNVFTQNNNPTDPAEVVVNSRVAGGYFLVGTSVNPDPDDPGRETNISATVQFDGQGGIVPGALSVVQQQSVVDGVHAGGTYTIDGLGGVTATLSSIFGSIELMGGQTSGDAGQTSSFGVGTFSMDNGDTNGRILLIERRSGVSETTLQGAYNFRGINSSSTDNRGIFRGSLVFDGAGGVTGQYFDRNLAGTLNAANPFNIGAGSQYAVAEDGTFTATLNVGQAEPLTWSGALGTSGEILFTNRMADLTAGSGSMSAAPGNVQARGILAQETTTTTSDLAFSNYTATYDRVEKKACDEKTSLSDTADLSSRTIKNVAINSSGALTEPSGFISGELSVNSEGEIEGSITVKDDATYTIEEGTLSEGGKIELTANFDKPDTEVGDKELTITLVRVANVSAQAEDSNTPSPEPLTATTISNSSPPGTTAFSTTLNPAPIVQILDQNGKKLTTDNTTVVTVSLVQPSPAPTPAGVLVGNLTATVANGQASFPDLQIAQPANGYRLSFAATGLPTVTSTPFNVSNTLVPASLRFSQQPQDAPAGITLNLPVTVEVLDQNGGVLTTDNTTSVDIALVQTTGNLTGTLNQTAVGGLVTFDGLQVDQAGLDFTLQATSGALSSADSDTFEVTPAPTTTLFVTDEINPATLAFRYVSGLNIFADGARPSVELATGGLLVSELLERNGFVYLAMTTVGTGDPKLFVVNAQTGVIDQTLTLGTNEDARGFELAFSGNGQTLFLADENKAQLRAYSIDGVTGQLTEFNPATGVAPAMPLTFPAGASALAYDNVKNQLVLPTNDLQLQILDYNPTTRVVSQATGSPFPFTEFPSGVVTVGNFAYMSGLLGEVLVLDTATYPTVTSRVPTTGPNPQDIFLHPDGGFLYLDTIDFGTGGFVETFKINPGGSVTNQGQVAVPGVRGPGEFAFANVPGGKALVVTTSSFGGTTLDGFALYSLDPTTGLPQTPPVEIDGNTGNPANSLFGPVRLTSGP